MQAYQTLIGFLLGGSVVAVALRGVIVQIWVMAWPKLCEYLDAQTAKIGNEELRAKIVELVHAAEQIFGPQPEDATAAAELGNQKLAYVQSALRQAGLTPETRQIESAVHQVKAAAKLQREIWTTGFMEPITGTSEVTAAPATTMAATAAEGGIGIPVPD